MASEPKPHLSFHEYLGIEREAETKSEYHDGMLYAMAGGTGDHSSIAVNATVALATLLVPRGCRVFDSNMRIYIPLGNRCVYPDAAATCENPVYWDKSNDVLLNPALVIEVLSPSTRNYDRGDKFVEYRSIRTFREYLVVEQNEMRIEQWSIVNGHWTLTEHRHPEDTIHLLSLEIGVPVSSFYLGIDLPSRK